MLVEAIPLTDFVHGHIDAREGRPIVPWIEESVALELERAGLVRIRLAHAKPVHDKAEPGKAPDDGTGQPSSASPAAPVSTMTTSGLSRHGPGKPRKSAA